MDAGQQGGGDDGIERQVRVGEGDVVADGRAEDVRPLGDDAELAPHRAEVEVGEVESVQGDAPGGRGAEADEELGQGGFARPGRAGDPDPLAGVDHEGRVLHHQRRRRPVAEGDRLGPDLTVEGPGVGDGGADLLDGRVEDVVDAGHVAAELRGFEAGLHQRDQGLEEPGGQGGGGQHRPERQVAVEHGEGAVDEDGQGCPELEGSEQGLARGGQPAPRAMTDWRSKCVPNP